MWVMLTPRTMLISAMVIIQIIVTIQIIMTIIIIAITGTITIIMTIVIITIIKTVVTKALKAKREPNFRIGGTACPQNTSRIPPKTATGKSILTLVKYI